MTTKTLAAALLMAGNAVALPAISIKGTKFFFENGTQFFMKGVAYQQEVGAAGEGFSNTNFKDPLADPEACARDVPLLQELGTNIIRTYAIDPSADHDECMGLLEDAGIYVISDLGEPKNSINRDEPRWDTTIFQRYKDVVDELMKYDNVVGFFAGNEVSNDKTNTDASAYVKAAVRDVKAHIASRGGRKLPVGYAANDDPDIRVDLPYYFNCGDEADAIDFFGYNIYSWCGENTIKGSGYGNQIEFFRNYSVPVFFAEYGCNEGSAGAEGRIFQETTALYEDEMTEVFSGGIVYMYFQEANDYGLVELEGDEAVRMNNFDKLAERIADVDPTLTDEDDYTPSNKPQACPPISDTWAASDVLPPTPDEQTCQCMFNSLTCIPTRGLDPEEYGDIFGFICGEPGNPCAGISSNGTTGVHGAYSMCGAEQQLGFVLDRYYQNQNSVATACDFDGKATIKTPTEDSKCSEVLASASRVNEVAATATGLGNNGGDEDDSGASPRRIDAIFSFGGFAVGAYVVAAVGVGAGMILI